jgi:hypothetical protein
MEPVTGERCERLPVVRGRHGLEEDASLGRVDVEVHPVGPGGKAALERHRPVHVHVVPPGLPHVIPPARTRADQLSMHRRLASTS